MIISLFSRATLAVTLALCVSWTSGASAQITTRDRYASLVVEARNGQVLSAANADETRHPASLTKMMTLYMLFEAMRDGRLNLGTPIRVSAEAASRPPSKLGVPAGGSISTETAILALVTRSANDIAAAVGEALAGDEDAFARAMTMRARSLGMTRTTFRNASGLPDPEQVTTARDMALLGRRLIADFPDHYHYFSVQYFAHGNRMIRNHNGMLRDYPGTDGIKTGFINASGFNIVTSAQREGVRLVGVVFGGSSWPQRNNHMAELLDDGFQRMGVRSVPVMASAAPRVVAGRDPTVGPGPRRVRVQTATRPATQGQPRVQNVSTTRPVATRPATAPRPAASQPDRARRPASQPATQSRPAAAPRTPVRTTQPPAAPRAQQVARNGN
ncbi:serine hydrolase [Sediminicoccus sp. BL-A-41-H5]|uniref:D-alanyl-D-alanine carboxypeptidase family protein n=1 Tax=Sediminicoccus sp. BL-A-41-H5 TaxID=3421106 RepID=UPI003D675A98